MFSSSIMLRTKTTSGSDETANNGVQRRIQEYEGVSHVGMESSNVNVRKSVDNSNENKNVKTVNTNLQRGNGRSKGQYRTDTSAQFSEIADQIQKQKQNNALMSQLDYTQIETIPLEVVANQFNLWDFCVGFAALGMNRRGSNFDFVTLGNGQPVSVYYLAAVTLFYNVYLASIGEVPTLQRMSKTILDLLHAVSPTLRNSFYYAARWTVTFENLLIAQFPYQAYQNPEVSLAPETGLENGVGQKTLSNVIPVITPDDLVDVGGDAFEQVLRYVLGLHSGNNLLSYTVRGQYSNNVAVFAQQRGSNVEPIQGVEQLISEVPFGQDDTWLAALKLFAGVSTLQRQGWTVKTVQVGTHYALLRLLQDGCEGVKVNRALIKPIDIGASLAQETCSLIAAEYNFAGESPGGSIANSPILPQGFTNYLTYGQLISNHITEMSRRFFLASCLCTGTPMYDPNVTLIGAGAKYLTTPSPSDAVPTAYNFSEDLAALSLYYDGILELWNIPPLTTRGNTIIGNALGPDLSEDGLLWFEAIFPWASGQGFNFNFAAPGGTDIPNSITLNPASVDCVTQGSNVVEAQQLMSALWAELQGNMMIGPFISGADGECRRHLNGVHIINTAVNQQGYNVVADTVVTRLMTTRPVSARLISTYTLSIFPIVALDDNQAAAFQSIYKMYCSVDLDNTYIQYRAPRFVTGAHPIASNANVPSETDLADTVRIYMGEGGGFFESIFDREGKWVDTLSALAGGLGGLLSDDLGKAIEGVARTMGRAAHKTWIAKSIDQRLLTPYTHGLASKTDMMRVAMAYHGGRVKRLPAKGEKQLVKGSVQRKNNTNGKKRNNKSSGNGGKGKIRKNRS